jgi:dipeptidyl aminopeptidase/acylaminoacyl peptidase
VLPIWAGSYELKVPIASDALSVADASRRGALIWNQELSTTLDYLETRNDIDSQHIGYFGLSFGAYFIGPIALSMEGRIKTGVLASGGVPVVTPPHPMVDVVNYAPHITMPVLMLNGRYDYAFPYKQSQQRMFNLLGTPANQKMHIVYDTGHVEYPPNSLARDTSNWFDKYLGAVR